KFASGVAASSLKLLRPPCQASSWRSSCRCRSCHCCCSAASVKAPEYNCQPEAVGCHSNWPCPSRTECDSPSRCQLRLLSASSTCMRRNRPCSMLPQALKLILACCNLRLCGSNLANQGRTSSRSLSRYSCPSASLNVSPCKSSTKDTVLAVTPARDNSPKPWCRLPLFAQSSCVILTTRSGSSSFCS